MSGAGPPGTTYDDGFPKAPPTPPALSAVLDDSSGEVLVRDLKRLRAPNLPTIRWLECGRDRRSTSVLRCTPRRPERRVEGGRDGWAFGNPSSYVVTGVPLTHIQADG